jgi:NAD(P)-dependent dehydrogenase (short-subunit alcohol dehydrogenase family)
MLPRSTHEEENMTKRFENKVALVTGGSSGIGRATAVALAREGAKVVVASRGQEGNQETVELIRKAGGEASALRADMSKPADIEAMVRHTVERYGRLDCAFNNAGASGQPGPLHEQTEEDWDALMNTNLKAVWLCMKYQVRQMLAQGGGSIVNTSSMAGLIGVRGLTPYVASKHGVVGLTKTAALDYATSGIRVNVICPTVITGTAMIDTLSREMPQVVEFLKSTHPIGRTGTTDEVASAVLWLLSDEASFITGTALPVDGGTYAGR